MLLFILELFTLFLLFIKIIHVMSEISQNCRFLKENNILSPFLCANNGCKNSLDQDFQKSLCICSEMFTENKNKKFDLIGLGKHIQKFTT